MGSDRDFPEAPLSNARGILFGTFDVVLRRAGAEISNRARFFYNHHLSNSIWLETAAGAHRWAPGTEIEVVAPAFSILFLRPSAELSRRHVTANSWPHKRSIHFGIPLMAVQRHASIGFHLRHSIANLVDAYPPSQIAEKDAEAGRTSPSGPTGCPPGFGRRTDSPPAAAARFRDSGLVAAAG